MAKDDDDHKSSWSSWLAPADSRHAQGDAQQRDTPEHLKHRADHSSPPEPSRSDPPESTPLIAFKHFLDDKAAAIVGFPSNLAELRRKKRDAETRAQRQTEDHYKRWTGNTGTWGKLDMEYLRRGLDGSPAMEEAKEAALELIEESNRRNSHIPIEKMIALWTLSGDCDDEYSYNAARGMFGWPHYCPKFKRDHQVLPSADELLSADWREYNRGFDKARWLSIDWFKHSPYSPTNLEADSHLSRYDTKWRNAFEDLLEAALDKPMTSQEKFGQRIPTGLVTSTWRGPGLDWMLSLQCRGILPPQLPTRYSGPFDPKSFKVEHVSTDIRGIFPSVPGSGVLNPYARVINSEVLELIKEIATPVESPRMDPELQVSEQQAQLEIPLPGGIAEQIDDDQLAQLHEEHFYEDQSTYDEPREGSCPDELGRAVGEAAKHRGGNYYLRDQQQVLMNLRQLDGQNTRLLEMREKATSPDQRDSLDMLLAYDQKKRELLQAELQCRGSQARDFSAAGEKVGGPITELDVYEHLAREENRHNESSAQTEHPYGKCPDELGRAVGEAAKPRGIIPEEYHKAPRLHKEHNEMHLLRAKLSEGSDKLTTEQWWFLTTRLEQLLRNRESREVEAMLRLEYPNNQGHDVERSEEKVGGPITKLDVYEHLNRMEARDQAIDDSSAIANCPDELGRSVAVKATNPAVQEYHENLRRLDEQNSERMRRAGFEVHEAESWREQLREMILQRDQRLDELRASGMAYGDSPVGRCPDELGRAVGEAARQQAARAFVDEENGLNENDTNDDFDFERFLASDDIAPKPNFKPVSWDELCGLVDKMDKMDGEIASLDSMVKSLLQNSALLFGTMNDDRRNLYDLAQDLYRDCQDLHQERVEREAGMNAVDAQRPAIDAYTQDDTGRPQVLSTLTTTQTTRLPNGSVQTTIVLKRRFADGREEMQESSQTSFDEPAAAVVKADQEPRVEEKKGWFWN